MNLKHLMGNKVYDSVKIKDSFDIENYSILITNVYFHTSQMDKLEPFSSWCEREKCVSINEFKKAFDKLESKGLFVTNEKLTMGELSLSDDCTYTIKINYIGDNQTACIICFSLLLKQNDSIAKELFSELVNNNYVR